MLVVGVSHLGFVRPNQMVASRNSPRILRSRCSGLNRVNADESITQATATHYMQVSRTAAEVAGWLAMWLRVTKRANRSSETGSTESKHTQRISNLCAGQRAQGEFRLAFESAHTAEPEELGRST